MSEVVDLMMAVFTIDLERMGFSGQSMINAASALATPGPTLDLVMIMYD